LSSLAVLTKILGSPLFFFGFAFFPWKERIRRVSKCKIWNGDKTVSIIVWF
jgi:hypothetical protein